MEHLRAPLLFLLYINDLPQLVKGKVKPMLFADDTGFIVSNLEPQIIFHQVKVVMEIMQN
jgi:hypothetical protein